MSADEYRISLRHQANEYLQQLVDTISDVATDYIGDTVCACIKIIEPLHEVNDEFMWEEAGTRTMCRSSNTPQNRISTTADGTYPMKQNTDFRIFFDEVYRAKIDPTGLVTDGGSYFYVTNLKDFDDDLRTRRMRLEYTNSRENYDDYYLGTLIVPISGSCEDIPYTKRTGDETLGFLCIDTKSGSAFTTRRKSVLKSILDAALPTAFEVMSDYRYYWYKDTSTHTNPRRVLENTSNSNASADVKLKPDMTGSDVFMVTPGGDNSSEETPKKVLVWELKKRRDRKQ